MENLHNSVMINEIISFLPLKKSINVIDATFGGGGYSKTILEKFNVNHDQFIKKVIARWQKGQKIFAFLYWI